MRKTARIIVYHRRACDAICMFNSLNDGQGGLGGRPGVPQYNTGVVCYTSLLLLYNNRSFSGGIIPNDAAKAAFGKAVHRIIPLNPYTVNDKDVLDCDI